MRRQQGWCWVVVAVTLLGACATEHKRSVPADASTDAASTTDASFDTGIVMTADAGNDAAVATPDVVRGRYIVEHLAACGDCHTPRKADGKPDLARAYAGVKCFLDVAPADAANGCIHTRNLTSDDTGLKPYTDQQIKDMFQKGVRPKGDPKGDNLHPFMPYWMLGNMSDADADSIVAFLRTLPAVHNALPARSQAPFTPPAAPAPLLDLGRVPTPDSNQPNYAAAMRGRYIAANIGVCYECHTPRDAGDRPILTKAFAGGRDFARDSLGLPASLFPSHIYAANLTSDATGLRQWSVDQIVIALLQGVDDEHKPLCPPMPAGPMGAFGGMKTTDALDIAYYLKSLPPVVNSVAMCIAGVSDPDAGTAGNDAGANDAGN